MSSGPFRAVRGLALDLSPLSESRDFRRLSTGLLVSLVGRQLTTVAVPYQVYLLTRSSFAVGMIGLVQVVPVFAVGLYAGALADRVDRRRLLIVAMVLLAATSGLFIVGAVRPGTPLVYIYAVTAVAAAVGMFEQPTRSAMVPRLVTPAQVPAALALNQVIFQTGLIVGPALAGLVLARASIALAYALDAISYLIAAGFVVFIAAQPPADGPRPAGLKAPLEAISFIRGKPELLSIFLIDLNAMIFGMPRAVFPALATTVFRTGPTGLGLLYSSLGVGGLGGAVFTGWVSRVVRRGRVVIWSVAAWGVGITAFGVTTLVPSLFALGMLMLALASAADVFSAIFRGTILQLAVPDAWRGRMSALNIMVVTGGPRLGDAETGTVAQLTTAPIAVISGGIACLAGVAVLVLALPALWNYRSDALPAETAS